MTDILSRRFSPSPDAVESAVGDETVLLHLVSGTYYGLDVMGTEIWAMIKQGVALSDICLTLAREYAVDPGTIEKDARKFLGDLEAQGLLIDG